MGDEAKTRVNFDKEVEDKSSSGGPAKSASDLLMETSPDQSGGQLNRSISLLARAQKLLTLRGERVRAAAAHLTETQDELVRAVSAVRDLAKTAAGLTREPQFLSVAAAENLQPGAQAVIFLAKILNEIYAVSSVTRHSVESQSGKMRELTETIGEAARVSTYLTGKVAALVEGTRFVLPPLSSRNLVEGEIKCLTGELETVLAGLRTP